jgi:hypothetical protein
MKLEVGKKYTSKNNREFECIVATDTHVWMKGSDYQTAYVWTIDGKSASLSEEYDLKPQPREFWLYGDNGSPLSVNTIVPSCTWDTVIHVREVMPE